jgi:hypothetical protein
MIAIARNAHAAEAARWKITRVPKLGDPALYYVTPANAHANERNTSEFNTYVLAADFIQERAWAHALETVAPLIRENKPIG